MIQEKEEMPASATAATAQARSELQEYLSVSQQRRHLFPRSALVGLCAGIVAVIFRLLLTWADLTRNSLLAWAHQSPTWGWLAPVCFGAVGAALSVFLVRRYAPEASGSGIPHLKATFHRLRELRWWRVLPIKMLGGMLALGSGMALGREGPTVQMGGAVGDAIARWLNASARDRLVLIASGAGAGLAAAFNAPLSGLVFILEEVQRDFRPVVFGAAFLAAAVADIVARFATGQLPVFSVPSYAAPPLAAMPAFVALGIIAGLLGVLFNWGIIVTLNLFDRIPAHVRVALAGFVGALAGLLAWFSPQAVGGGHHLAEQALAGNFLLAAIPFWFLLRFGLSLVSYGTGAPGGIFAPLLVLGALAGLAVGLITQQLVPAIAPEPAVFAVVGMAAYFTAIVRAPLTGVVLILEMTGNYGQMLPLLVSCFAAYAVAEGLKTLPIYEALLERDLVRGGLRPVYKEPIVVEMTVEEGAPFMGKMIKELALPPGCIIVNCYEDEHEFIPTATTQLLPHMRITAVISPQAANALSILRRGCEAATRGET
ncbi:MAG: H(+)/Cl(-) exchange transporter ClcA [Caldilineaceae bacterium]|nr:H(+)/Cl(-) exchange transporter ClcA [Caldilineaceae bacterium]